jgi:hypothetical protein
MRALYIFSIAAALATAAATGCSGDDTNPGTNDAQSGDDVQVTPDGGTNTGTYPAFAIDAPQVVTAGGPVLTNPKIQPVFFPGFDYPTQLTDFASKIGASSYWAALSEYKVGPITSLTPITLTNAQIVPADIGSINDAYIQSWLVARFDGSHPEFGTTPDANAIYTLFYPTATTISLGGGGGSPDGGVPDGGFGGFNSQSCVSFGGYHGSVQIGSQLVAYAVIPECGTFGNLVGVNAETATTSHELSEAATDPYTPATPAYGQVDADHIGWEFFLGGGEIGDMCAQFPDSFYVPSDFGFMAQRNWSNANAVAGHDPCVPVPSTQPYFNSMPVLTDSVATRGGNTTKGIMTPVGQAVTVEVDLFSDAPTTGPWTVSAQAYSRTSAAPVTVSFDTNKGQNGDKVHMTLTATAAFTGTKTKNATLLITSVLGVRQTQWIAILGQ